MTDKKSDSSTIHSVLHFIISRAVMEGKLSKSSLRIPLTDLRQEFEDGKINLGEGHFDNTDGVVLVVKLSTDWDSGTEDDLEFEDEEVDKADF